MTGWICPKCGRVYAPFILECAKCNDKVEDTLYTSAAGTWPANTSTTTQDIKLDKELMSLGNQMICDSQGCREVDLLGRPIKPINSVLETLMSPEQLKELADRIPARDEDIRESSFEVMLEDDVQDWVDTRDWYLLKVEYDRAGVTQPSDDCQNQKWECPQCRCLFYDFPYKGCFCGTKGEEMLQIAE